MKAFTLVEILAVIAIIAICCAILFPIFASARKRALATDEASNMKQEYTAFMLYEEDRDGQDPSIQTQVLPYLRDPRVFSSQLDTSRPPLFGSSWTAEPFLLCTMDPETIVPFKVSFGYLKNWYPYDRDERAWAEVRQLPNVGLLASPWIGDVVPSSIDPPSACGPPSFSFTGPEMKGSIQRICMDGSLYVLHTRRNGPESLGAFRTRPFLLTGDSPRLAGPEELA